MKCVKGLLSVVLGTMLISTVAFADVPNKVAVIGDKAYDLDYVNDPKNVDEIRKLLSEGKPVMVKVRDQWYNNNGEIKEEKNAPFKMSYKNSEGAVQEITTAYFEKQSSIIVGIENSKEIKIIFNDEMDKELLSKELLKFNGELLGENDEIIIDEENKVVTIKFSEDINLENDVVISIGNDTDKEENIEKNIKIIKSQEDLKGVQEKFYDIAILGDDISLDLSEVEGNVFVSGNNIEITKLNNENLQVSEKSEKIVVSESKIDNINVEDEDEIEIKDSEVANVNKEEKEEPKEEKKPEDEGEETKYVAQWTFASIESFEVKTSDQIKVVFKDEFDSMKDVELLDNFKILQDGKEFSVNRIFAYGKQVYFCIDSEIQKVDGKWVSKNKLIADKEITLKYDSEKKTKLTINSSYVKSFEVKIDNVSKFQSADDSTVKVEEGKSFNGSIDNENKIIKIYEDMTDAQLRDVLFATNYGYLMTEVENENRIILLVGADGSVNEYAVQAGKPSVTVKEIEFFDFQKMKITFNQKISSAHELNSDSMINSLFRVYIDDKAVDLSYGILNEKSVTITIDDTIDVVNNEFVRRNIFKKGSKIKVEYFGGEDGLLIGEYDIESFEKETVVNEEFSSIDGKKLELKDEAFPGEITDDEIILFQDWNEDFGLLFNSVEIPSNSFIQRSFEFPNYLFFCGYDGAVKGYEIIERVQDIEFDDNEDRLIRIGDEIEVEFVNYNGMKLSLEVGDDNIINANLDGNKISVEALNEGVSEIKVIGEMVRSDGTIIPNSSIAITKEVNVAAVEVENVVLPASISIIQDRKYELEALVYPKNATYKELTWYSSNEEVALVDSNGVVTAIAQGEADIIAEANNGVMAICKVKVIDKVLYLDVSVNGKEAQISLEDISKDEDMALLQIENVTTGNLEVFNKYDLVEGSNTITFQLEKGRYKGYIRIKDREKYFVKEFNID